MVDFKEQNWPSRETGESAWMKKGGASKLGCDRLQTAWTTEHPATTIQKDDTFFCRTTLGRVAKATGQWREQRSSPPSALTPQRAMTLRLTNNFIKKVTVP